MQLHDGVGCCVAVIVRWEVGRKAGGGGGSGGGRFNSRLGRNKVRRGSW